MKIPRMSTRVKLVTSILLFITSLVIMRQAAQRTDTAAAPSEPTLFRTMSERADRGVPRTTELADTTSSSSTTSSSTTSSSTSQPPTTQTIVHKKSTTTVRAAGAVTTQVGRPSSNGQWMALIRQYPWDANHAYRIMMCESSGNPSAVNRASGATGLFQIHPGGSKYLDPATNVAAAYAKYQASGWRPWVCKA